MKAIRRNPDISRLSRAAQRPGIDPREWVKYGIIQELGFDADHGIFADVKLMPNGEEETCSVGSNYAGNGYGEWAGLEVGDVVKIEYPEGTAESTPVISERLWNAAHAPPSQMQDPNDATEPTKDRVLVVKPGQSYKVYVSQGGKVQLGGDGAVVLANGTPFSALWDALKSAAAGIDAQCGTSLSAFFTQHSTDVLTTSDTKAT